MSKLSSVMDKVVADLQAKYGSRNSGQLSEERRNRRKAAPLSVAPAEPAPSSFDADHETSRGIRSVWD